MRFACLKGSDHTTTLILHLVTLWSSLESVDFSHPLANSLFSFQLWWPISHQKIQLLEVYDLEALKYCPLLCGHLFTRIHILPANSCNAYLHLWYKNWQGCMWMRVKGGSPKNLTVDNRLVPQSRRLLTTPVFWYKFPPKLWVSPAACWRMPK